MPALFESTAGRRLVALIGTLVVTVAMLATQTHAASALSCGQTFYGDQMHTDASYDQWVSTDYCTGGVVRVGVYVQPLPGYNASHIKNCTAHLVLTDLTLGAATRNDRPVNCTAGARTGVLYTAGPSIWTNQDRTHYFRAEAWVNVETISGKVYRTDRYRSTTYGSYPPVV